MTNLTKPNILIRTNTFINANATNPVTANVRYASSKPEKYVRRSISGIGSFLLANKHNFKKPDNKPTQVIFEETNLIKAFKSKRMKKNEIEYKHRNKNETPNSDIFDSPVSDLSTSSTSSTNSVSSPKQSRPKINRQKTDLFISSNFNSQTPIQEVNNKGSKFDLYRSSPTLFYIKEKYKMYLDWLNENSNKENQIQSKQILNDPNQAPTQLNWYNYEKIVYLNEANDFDYLKYVQNENSAQVTNNQANIELNYKKEPLSKEQSTRLTSSSMSFNKFKTNRKIKTARASSQQETILKNNEIKIKEPEPMVITNLNNNNNVKSSPSLNLKNLLTKLSNSRDIFENSTSSTPAEKLPKGVKFDQCMNSNTISLPAASANQPVTLLKPILKSTNNSIYTNENYFNNVKLNKTITPPEQNNLRRVSIISLNSSIRSDKTSIASNNSPASKNFSNLKLPPIVNCSDDFYAVLHDLEKDNLIK